MARKIGREFNKAADLLIKAANMTFTQRAALRLAGKTTLVSFFVAVHGSILEGGRENLTREEAETQILDILRNAGTVEGLQDKMGDLYERQTGSRRLTVVMSPH